MITRGRKSKKSMSEINVVPYIDVMLVLLIIFMITAPLLTQGVKVKLPQASAKSLSTKGKEPLIVSVDSYGRYYLNVSNQPDKPIAPETLATRVAAQIALNREEGVKQAVLIRGDRAVNYGKVVIAMALLKKAGVENVGLVTVNSQKAKNKHE